MFIERNVNGSGVSSDLRPRRALSAPFITLVILTSQLLPPLPQYLGAATSMALGTMMAASAIMLISLLNYVLPTPVARLHVLNFDCTIPVTILSVAAFIVLHATVADTLQSLADLKRCLTSFLPMAFVLAGGMVMGRELGHCSDASLDRGLSVSFWILSFVMIMQLVGLQPRPDYFVKSIFPFTETSHFALAFFPVLLYQTIRARPRARPWWLIGGAVTALLLQSLSLLVGCLIAAAACRRLLLITALGVGLLLVGLPLQLDYYAERLDFSGEVANLSNLVYVQGWQMVFESWTLTSGWGIGFQQLGMRDTLVVAAEVVRRIMGGADANVTDGSFVLAKMVSEFGAWGLALVLLYLVFAARCMKGLRRGRDDPAVTFAHCVVVAYSIDIFVRGTGYFTQSTFIFVAALAVLLTRTPTLRIAAPGEPVKAASF